MTSIAYWWFLFAATHMIGSSVPVRTGLIKHLGRLGFRLLYSVIAIATFVPLCRAFAAAKGTGGLLFTPDPALHAVTYVLVVLAFIVLLQALATPTPMSLQSDFSGAVVDEARGIHRVTRHPMNWAFILFAVGHLVVNPYGADLLFWGGFILYGVASAIHQDRRLLTEGRSGFGPFYLQTSLVPFWAMIRGRQRLGLGEYNGGAVVVALVAAAALRWFHTDLFGGFGG